MPTNDRGIRRIITAGLLLAITLLMVFARIGMIPMPTPAGNATIAHIPAIIGAILEGPLVGLIVGMGFGFASFSSATIPMFKDPLVALVPRLFIGLAAASVYGALRKASKRMMQFMLFLLVSITVFFAFEVAKSINWLGLVVGAVAIAGGAGVYVWMRQEDVRIVGIAVAAAIGSLTNTVLVLAMAVVRGYIPGEVAWGIGLSHGLPEALVSAVITVAVVAAVQGISGRKKGSDL